MPLETVETTWLKEISKAAPAFETESKRLAARTEALTEMGGEVGALRDELAKAHGELKVTLGARDWKRFWDANAKKSMGWMTGDADEEVDTHHDLVKGYGLTKENEERAKQIQKLHEKLVNLQNEMLAKKGPDGKPLFTAKDVQRELWSPLVQAGVIPSNAVADDYSHDHQVFLGASALYQERLKEHTKTASKYENAQSLLRLGNAAVGTLGTLASGVIELEALPVTNIGLDKVFENDKNLKALKTELAKPVKDQDPKKIAGLKKKTEEFKSLSDTRLQKNREVARDKAALKLAIGFVQGGLGITETALNRPSEKKKIQIAEQFWNLAMESAINSFDVWAKNKAATTEEHERAGFRTMAQRVPLIMKTVMKGGTFGFRALEIVRAEKKEDAVAAAKKLVDAFADATFLAFAAVDSRGGENPDKPEGENAEGTETQGNWAQIGALAKQGIISTKGWVIIGERLWTAARSEGGSMPSKSEIIAALGVGVLDGLTIAAVSSQEALGDVVRKDITGVGDQEVDNPKDLKVEDRHAFTETGSAKDTRERGVGQSMSDTTDTSQAFLGLMDLASSKGDPDAMAKEIERLQMMQEMAEKQSEIETFRKQMAENEEFKAEFVKKLKEASDQDEELTDLIDSVEAASVPSYELDDEAKAKRAAEAVDKLIKQAAACNARWKVMTSIARGGTAVLVAALPAAGLAASIARLATDIAILIRKSYHVNRWRKNMALTYGNGSVYAPAIQRQLASCIVQVSEQTVRTIYDIIGVTADTLKLADASGVGGAVGAAGHGMEIGNNMARALTEFAFKVRQEAEIRRGWQVYKKALESPADRKLARTAMRWNTTLAKCVIAYGIVIDQDPIAKEVGRSCGLTPELVADQKAVCPKIVTYFETLYSDDPVVLRRVPLVKDWHPGSPVLTLESWTRFKIAANEKAVPPLDDRSLSSDAVDQALARLAGVIGPEGDYAKKRDADWPYEEESLVDQPRAKPEFGTWLGQAKIAVEAARKALDGYKPLNGPAPKGTKADWVIGNEHAGMAAIATSLLETVLAMAREIEVDLEEHNAFASV